MNKISLITVFNNQSMVDEMINSAKRQNDADTEFIMIDNRNNKFNSAAAALNYGVEKASGDVLVFLHQDIEFISDDVLKKIYNFAMNNKNVIFGAAGVLSKAEEKSGAILANFYHGSDKSKYDTIDKPTKCFTLDECLIACCKDIMAKVRFDERVCDGWHLYGADLCLSANLEKDLSVMVVPMNIWHKSNGNADKSYMITQDRLAKKYKGKYSVINTTNGYAYTNGVKRALLNLYRKIKYRGV